MREKARKITRNISQFISLSLIAVGVYMVIVSLSSPSTIYQLKVMLGIWDEVVFEEREPNRGSVFNEQTMSSLEKIGVAEIENELVREKTYCHETVKNSRCIKIMKDTVKIVPDNILNQVINDGFDIVLAGGNLRELVYEETGWDTGTVYDGVAFPGYAGYRRIWSSGYGGSSVLIHEIGHAYDFAMDTISGEAEFMAIYKAEAKKLFWFEKYFRSTEREYFAESFKFYLKYPVILKWFAPQTFDYFNALID